MIDKKSALYFMTEMTQEEFSNLPHQKIQDFEFNMIKKPLNEYRKMRHDEKIKDIKDIKFSKKKSRSKERKK